MTGEILENRIFMDTDTRLTYDIVGVYDAYGEIRKDWKFRKGHKAEANDIGDGKCIIKFEP